MTERICRNCAWWDKIDETTLEQGLCRYHPPHPEFSFPATLEDDWCRLWAAERGWGEGRKP